MYLVKSVKIMSSASSGCTNSTELLDLLTICPDCPLLLTGPVDSIQSPHKADVSQPPLVCPCVGVHRSMSLMSLLL